MSNRNSDGTFKAGERSGNPSGRPAKAADTGEFHVTKAQASRIIAVLAEQSAKGGPAGKRATLILSEHFAAIASVPPTDKPIVIRMTQRSDVDL